MLAQVGSASVAGVESHAVSVEVNISLGLPSSVVVGLPDSAVREGRERVTAALRHVDHPVPHRRITANLAPADMPKEGSDQSTGRLIRIPNSKILTDPIANYTSEFPFLWHEISVVITFESDWRKAKELLLDMVIEAIKETSRMAADSTRKQPSRMLMLVGTVTATVYTSVLDHGICLSMRFLTDPQRRRGFNQTLWEGVLNLISNEPDIQLAYPT
jgi:small-conductance mechanosensitive channel